MGLFGRGGGQGGAGGGKWDWPMVSALASLLESLNPEIPYDTRPPEADEYISRWYLHPMQHAAEMVVCAVIFGPLLVVTYRKMVRQMRALRIRYEPSRAQVLWAYLLLMTLLLQTPLKLDVQKVSSHPAYFLQPCHVSTIGYYLATVIPSEFSFIVFHGLSLLTWGPSLAFCFPNLPETQYEVVMFWLQHILLVTAPLFAVNKYHRPLYRSFAWNYFSFVVLSAYHWLMLLPWGILTGINVATMLSPPPALVPFGRAYRPVQGAACFLLQNISVVIHLGLSALVERRGALVGGGKAEGKAL